MMTSKALRDLILTTLNAHTWAQERVIRAVSIDGTPESMEAFEGDLRNEQAGCVLCLSQTLKSAPVGEVSRGRAVLCENTLAVIIRVNPATPGAPDLDDVRDEVMLTLKGIQAGGAEYLTLSGDGALMQDARGLLTTRVQVSGRVVLR